MKKIFSARISWRNINIPLLLFLILFLNVKFVIKLIAIVLLVLFARNLRLGLSWKNPRLPLFYSLIIAFEVIKYFILIRTFTLDYSLVFAMGILQWGVSLFAIHHIKLFIEKDDTEKIHNTIKTFFLLNFLVSIFFLVLLIFFPSVLSYWGHGADISFSSSSAGDTILGISFDSSIVNAAINCIGLIYFLYKKEYLFTLMCMLTISLCTSNFTLIFILLTLALMFVTVRQKKLRLAVFVNTILLIVFYLVVSPSNRQYVRNYFIQLYILNKNPELVSNDPSPLSMADSGSTINREPVNKPVPDTVYRFDNKKLEKALDNLVSLQKAMPDSSGVPELYLTDTDFKTKPGKLISFFQTFNYLRSSPENFLFGSGIGRFSGKLAFRAAGVNELGSYPEKYRYTAPEFEKNHLRTFLFYQNSDESLHSVLNYPFSVYNQLPGEYGLVGVILFVIFYVGYFIKRYRLLSYGRYLILLLFAFFLMDYWFEMYSLIIIFELIMLLDIKENSLRKQQEGISFPS